MFKFAKQYWEDTSQRIAWGHWFTFFNIMLAITIGSRYAFVADWPTTLLGRIYFFINMLGQFSFIVFALYLLVLFPLSFILKNPRSFQGAAIGLATIGLTLLLLDSEVFSRFGLHLSVLVLDLLLNPDNGELARTWQLIFVIMPFILLIEMLFGNWSWLKLRSLERQKWIKPVAYFFILCFMSMHLIYAWADFRLYRPITVQRSNLPFSYPMTARSFLAKNGFLDRAEYDQTISSHGSLQAPFINYPLHNLQFNDKVPALDVVLINVNGLRFDAINAEYMPNLAEFSTHSINYTHHYTGSNENNSALTALFYGLDGNYFESVLSQSSRSVFAKRLEQLNYRLGLFASDNFNSPLFKRSLFQNYPFDRQMRMNYQVTQQWQTWNKQTTQVKPSFSYIEYDLLNAMQNFKSERTEDQVHYYDQQLIEIDKQLGKVFAQLKQQNLDNTIVIITANRGYSFTASNNDKRNYFGRDITQVPLIIRWPGRNVGHVNLMTSEVDIVPTLMSQLLGTLNPVSDYSQGRDLLTLDENKRQWVFVSNQNWQVVVTANNEQYQIGKQGKFNEYNANYQPINSQKPPLVLFLQAFQQNRRFIDK